MVFMEWSEELSVGVAIIDEQHKKLLDIVNMAHESDLNKDKEDGEKVFAELIEFARVHFTTEEDFFKKCKYSGAGEHIAEHVSLIEKLLMFKDKFDKGECDCHEFLEFLKVWLEDHLKVMDHKYVGSFHACGLK